MTLTEVPDDIVPRHVRPAALPQENDLDFAINTFDTIAGSCDMEHPYNLLVLHIAYHVW